MGKDAFRWFTALLFLLGSIGAICAQENVLQDGRNDQRSKSSQDLKIEEAFPPLVFLPDEDGKPSVALAPSVKWEDYRQFQRGTVLQEEPRYLIEGLRLDVDALADHATIRCQINVRLLDDGMAAIPIRMGSTYITKAPVGTKLNSPGERAPNIANSDDTVTSGQADSGQAPGEGEPDPVAFEEAADSETEPAVNTVATKFTPVGIRLKALTASANPATAGLDEWELIIPDGKKSDVLSIEFESQVQVHRLGNESHLRLALPRVKSEMKIRVPIANAAGHWLTGDVISKESPVRPLPAPENAPKNPNKETTDFLISGLPADLDFVWYPQTSELSNEQLSFEVAGDIDVEVDALEGLLSDATFTVTSFNKPIEALVVKLPENTRLVETDVLDFGEYQVRSLEANGAGDDPEKASTRREVSVKLSEPTLDPPAIRLRVQAAKELTEYELAGFEVFVLDGTKRVPATVESGVVYVRSQGARRPKIQTGDFARRISGETTTRGLETFEYSRPNQIRLLTSRQSTELEIEPTYIVELEESRVTMTAIFQCNQRGGSLDSLVVDLGEWSFINVLDPNNVVDNDSIRNDEELEIPLTNAPDNFAISVQARLQLPESLSPTARELQLSFPVPRETQKILQAKVGIVREDSIVALAPSSSEYTETEPASVMQALAEVQAELFDDELISNAPLCFIKRTPGVPAALPVAVSKLQRRTNVDCDVELTDVEVIDESSIRFGVRQTMRWQIRNVPLQEAMLRMPRGIYQYDDETPNLSVMVDGKSRLNQNIRLAPGFLDAVSGSVSVRVQLDPRLGEFEMVLTYDWLYEDEDAPQDLTQRKVTLVDLPLVLPRRVSKSNDFRVDMRLRQPRVANYSVSLAPSEDGLDNWLAPTDPNTDFEAILDPDAENLPRTIPLDVQLAEVTTADTKFQERVDRAWFQTWLTHNTRTERAVFRLKGGGRSVRITLPQTEYQKLYVFVDGAPANTTTSEEGVLELELPKKDEGVQNISRGLTSEETHVIELQYWSDRREPPGLLTTRVPQVEGANILGQWFWHIVMPRNECMVTWPRTLTRAHEWDWSSILPNRRPERNLADLEEWTGAIVTGDQVLAGSTEYLFGAMGEMTTLSIRTTQLPLYLLFLAGTVFVFAVSMLYYRRQAWLLVLVGALIAGLIFLHPSYASIAGQVAVFGLLLVVLTTFLRWLVKQTVVRKPAPPTRDSGFDVSPMNKPGSSVVNVDVGAGTTTFAVGSSRVVQE